MKYAFILGRIPTLSIAEILSVFACENIDYKILALGGDILAVETKKTVGDAQSFLDKLGGTIKIIEVFGEVGKASDLKSVFSAEELGKRQLNAGAGEKADAASKLYWGISVYFICGAEFHRKQKISRMIQSYFFGVKEALREKLLKCRIVTPPPGKLALDAFAISKNGLIKKGGEFVAMVDKEKTYWGKTLAVQNFRLYGLRDYGRPGRDMKIGMMPPKLAQIMINLAKIPKGGKILDPFCGTGVVLQEGLMMGYSMIGSDSSKEAISLTQENISWLAEQLKSYSINLMEKKEKFRVYQAKVNEIGKFVPKKSIDGIVTEGTLGPKYGREIPNNAEIERNFKALEELYVAAFTEFSNVLEKGGTAVITLPVYLITKQKQAFVPFIDKIKNIGYNIVHPINIAGLKGNPSISLTQRETIVYSRPDQIVGREIIIFEKK